MIVNADHVPQLQRRKETTRLFATFLRDEPIQSLEGIIPMTRAQLLTMERRGEERIAVQQPFSQLTHRHSDLSFATEIVDLNFFGELLRFDNGQAERVQRYEHDWSLHLHADGGSIRCDGMLFEVLCM